MTSLAKSLLLIAALALLAGFSIERQRPPAATPKVEIDENRVYAAMCIARVTADLHDPDSAKLPNAMSAADWPSKFFVGKAPSKKFEVQFEGRAKNGFGGLRKKNFACIFDNTKPHRLLVKTDEW